MKRNRQVRVWEKLSLAGPSAGLSPADTSQPRQAECGFKLPGSKHLQRARPGWMKSFRSGQAGYATAEFALTIPAVILILVICLGALGAGAAKVQACGQARAAARALSIGESPAVAGGFTIQHQTQGDWLEVTASTGPGGFLPGIPQIKCHVSSIKEPDYGTFY